MLFVVVLDCVMLRSLFVVVLVSFVRVCLLFVIGVCHRSPSLFALS